MEFAHKLRSQHDAILVGKGCVLCDDPLLTNRITANQPQPVILDDFLQVPKEMKIFSHPKKPWIMNLQKNEDNYIKLKRRCPILCLEALKTRKIHSVLVEGGSKVLEMFLPISDEVYITVSPHVQGDIRVKIPELEHQDSFLLGTDVVFFYKRRSFGRSGP